MQAYYAYNLDELYVKNYTLKLKKDIKNCLK